MENNLSEAIAILEAFIASFPETEAIVKHTLFNVTSKDYLHNVKKRKPIAWSKARNRSFVNDEEWLRVDRALDTLLIWLFKECKKPKEKRNEKLLKERGRIAYLAFSIMGASQYSPIRTYQYALAHFMAKIRATGTREQRSLCENMKSGEVKWAICDILYPYANKRSNIKRQVEIMESALKSAEAQNQQILVEKIRKTLEIVRTMKSDL